VIKKQKNNKKTKKQKTIEVAFGLSYKLGKGWKRGKKKKEKKEEGK